MRAITRPARRPTSSWRASVFRRTLPNFPASRPGFLYDHRAVAQPLEARTGLRVKVLRTPGALGGGRERGGRRPESSRNRHRMYPIERRSTPRTTPLRRFANSNCVSHLRRAVTGSGPTGARWLPTAWAATRSPLALSGFAYGFRSVSRFTSRSGSSSTILTGQERPRLWFVSPILAPRCAGAGIA